MNGPIAVLAQTTSSPHKLRSLGFFLAGFFAVWTLWAWLLVRYPQLNQFGGLRVVVRVAGLFIRFVEGLTVLGHLGFDHNRAKGVLFGFLGFLVLAVVVGVQHSSRISHFALPTDPATWLNAILSAPIAEEVLFRGLVFRVLLERLAVWSALAVSALLFALIHLPYWWLSGAASPAGLVLRLGSIFAYGIFFALLYRWSGSLYAPVIGHGLNNLVTVSMGL
ncbi:MAG: CPBP family intramembrane metalloprotease [Verrucomicrobia bacterium]|nr:CPBP family intramembrane metalloprotease [Verrucomicrobiota bacterium]